MKGCKKCPAFNKCTVTYRGSACAALRGSYGIDTDPEILTNAEKIRSMSDDELAILLLKYEGTEKRPTAYGGHEHRFYGPKGEACGTKSYALMLWKDWLQEPADETTL